jgi:hypothetical protein
MSVTGTSYIFFYTNWYIRATIAQARSAGPETCGTRVKEMKIYVRERQKVGEGVESPKYRIVAVTGGSLQIEATHFRKFEIEQIAQDVKAEVVFMKPVDDEHKKRNK